MSDQDHTRSAALSAEQIHIYTEDQLIEKYGVHENEEGWKEILKRVIRRKCACSGSKMKSFIGNVIPITRWLPKYKVKEYLFGDIMAGLTVGTVHLPQGMAYALLASLPAISGLYVSFFPVLAYLLLGTSRHVSIGTYAVVSLMIAQVVNQHTTPCHSKNVTDTTASVLLTTESMSKTTASLDVCNTMRNKRKMEIAVALALANGLIQVAMSIFRLGIVTTFLSRHMISGFTCGAAFHVITSQIPKLLGISIRRHPGPLGLVYTYIDVFKNITGINWATFVISLCCVLLLIAGKEVNRRFRDRLPFSPPWELGVVILGTMASYFGSLSTRYHVKVVGIIPTGIEVSVPQGSDIATVFFSAVPIVIVAYVTEISLCRMFAEKHSYKIDADQELLALGVGNIIGSFFSCYPSGPSLSRSVIWEEVGAKTQLTGLFSSALILVIILWIGPLFESLPQAALAAIIVVNLKGLLMQFVKVLPLWRVSKWNALTWVVTWAAVVLCDVTLGLAVAVAFEILTVILRIQNVKGSMVASVGRNTDYRDIQKFFTEVEMDDHKAVVFRFPGPVIFVNKENFYRQICKVLRLDPFLTNENSTEEQNLLPDTQITQRNYKPVQGATYDRRGVAFHDVSVCSSSDSESPHAGTALRKQRAGNGEVLQHEDNGHRHYTRGLRSVKKTPITHLILDLQCCPFVDNDGAGVIKTLHLSLLKFNIKLFLVCNGNVSRTIEAVCEESRPPRFVSVTKAMDVATGRATVEFDEMGNVTPA